MVPKANMEKYTAELGADIGKQLVRFGKISKQLKRIVGGDQYEKESIPALLKAIDDETKDFRGISEWAAKMGVAKPMKSGGGRKRKTCMT